MFIYPMRPAIDLGNVKEVGIQQQKSQILLYEVGWNHDYMLQIIKISWKNSFFLD